MAEHEIPWRDMIAVLHRRRKLILQVLVGGVITVAVGVWTKAPSYRARATVMVTADRANVAVSPDADTGVTVARVTVEDLNSEVELMKSEALIRQVLNGHRQRLQRDDTFMDRFVAMIKYPLTLPGRFYRFLHDVEPPTAFDYWVEKVAANINVMPVTESNLIRVAYDADSPEWSATLVNELLAHHVERHTALSQQSEAQTFYESQRQLLAQRLNDTEAALQGFYEREGMESMPDRRTALRSRLSELESALEDADAELAAGKARVTYSSSAIHTYPKHIATESRDASVALIKPRILELELQRSELLSRYAPTSVAVQDIDRQIAEAKRLFEQERKGYAETKSALNPAYQTLEVDLAQTRAQVASVEARTEMLRGQVGEYRAKIGHIEEIASEQKRLEQEVAAARDAFATYSKKQEEARFSSALDASSIVNLAIAEPATVPTTPTGARKLVVVALGALMSLMAGIALAFLRDRIDPAVKSAAEAHDLTGLPVLAEVSR